MNPHATFRHRQGFSLIESAIVFAVIGLVVGGIWSAASSMNENRKWAQTEAGLMYYLDTITHHFNSQNTPPGSKDLNEWMEAATTPPAGWSARRTNPALPSTYTMTDPYGHWLTVQLNRFGGTQPVIILGYAWIALPTAKCARVLDLYQRMGKMHKLFYISSLPGSCSPNPTRTMSYYLSSNCCPSASTGYAGYFQLPYQ